MSTVKTHEVKDWLKEVCGVDWPEGNSLRVDIVITRSLASMDMCSVGVVCFQSSLTADDIEEAVKAKKVTEKTGEAGSDK